MLKPRQSLPIFLKADSSSCLAILMATRVLIICLCLMKAIVKSYKTASVHVLKHLAFHHYGVERFIATILNSYWGMEKDFEANKKGPFMSKAVFRPDESRRREEGHQESRSSPLHIILSNKDPCKWRCVTFPFCLLWRGGRGGARAHREPEQAQQGWSEACLYLHGSMPATGCFPGKTVWNVNPGIKSRAAASRLSKPESEKKWE